MLLAQVCRLFEVELQLRGITAMAVEGKDVQPHAGHGFCTCWELSSLRNDSTDGWATLLNILVDGFFSLIESNHDLLSAGLMVIKEPNDDSFCSFFLVHCKVPISLQVGQLLSERNLINRINLSPFVCMHLFTSTAAWHSRSFSLFTMAHDCETFKVSFQG